MNDARPLPPSQSAYRPFHNRETGQKIQFDVSLNTDYQKVTPLVTHDFKAAFHMTGQSILSDTDTLDYGFGVGEIDFKQFTSWPLKEPT